MGCNITLKGITDICKNNIGGIKRIYLTDREELVGMDYFEYPADDDHRRKTSVDIAATAGSLAEMNFTKYELKPELSNFVTTVTASPENNSIFYKTEVTLMFNGIDDEQYDALGIMLKGNFVAIIVLNNGDAIFIGNDAGLQASGGSINSGTAIADGVTEQLKFTCNSRELPRKINIAGKE